MVQIKSIILRVLRGIKPHIWKIIAFATALFVGFKVYNSCSVLEDRIIVIRDPKKVTIKINE